MKHLIVALGAMVVVIVGTGFIPSTTEVTTETVHVEVTPEWAEDTDAVEAAKAVIRRKEWEAELNTVQSEIEALEARETELEKELGTY